MGTHPIKPPKLLLTCFIQEALPFLSLVLLFCLSGQKEGHDIVFSQIWQLGEFFGGYSPIIPLIKYLDLPRSETRLVLQILLLMLVSGSEHVQEGVILLPDIPKQERHVVNHRPAVLLQSPTPLITSRIERQEHIGKRIVLRISRVVHHIRVLLLQRCEVGAHLADRGRQGVQVAHYAVQVDVQFLVDRGHVVQVRLAGTHCAAISAGDLQLD